MARRPGNSRLVYDKATRTIITEPNKRYDRLLRAFSELQAAAQFVVDETDRIHDNDPWPIKYRAPYDAITKLRLLLASQYGVRSPQLPAAPSSMADGRTG